VLGRAVTADRRGNGQHQENANADPSHQYQPCWRDDDTSSWNLQNSTAGSRFDSEAGSPPSRRRLPTTCRRFSRDCT
jgi:hypothetical protein